MKHRPIFISLSMIIIFSMLFGFSAGFAQAAQTNGETGVPNWEQVNTNGFGVSTAGTVTIRPFKGMLYAGAGDWENGVKIYRTADGVSWDQVTTPGEGLGDYRGVVLGMGVFKGKLYVGTGWSGDTSELWRTTEGTDWTRVLKPDSYSDGSAFDAIGVFNGQIYASLSNTVDGVTIYRSNTGDVDTWNPVVTYGNGNENNTTIHDFAVFNDQLYAVGANAVNGAFVWRLQNGGWIQVNTPGFDQTMQQEVNSIAVFDGILYVGTKKCDPNCSGQVWKTSNGTRWSRVNAEFSNVGYGDVTSLYSFGGSLIAVVAGGFGNAHGETVWRTTDAKNWQQINIDSWGDSANNWSMLDYAITSFNGQLYVGTNDSSAEGWGTRGAQIWKYLQP